MKKRILMMLMAFVVSAAVFGYDVVFSQPQFKLDFDDDNTYFTSDMGFGRVLKWFERVYDASDTTLVSGKELSYAIRITEPGVTAYAWGRSAAADINNCSWTQNYSTNITLAYDANWNGTLYLYVWLKWMRYNIQFRTNDGSAVAGDFSDICYTNSVVLPQSERTGYRFGGWTNETITTAITGSKTGGDLGVDNDDTTITLYAAWTPRQYTATFNANGGTGGKTVTQDYGSALTAPTVARTGYTFMGWSPAVPSTVPANDVTYTAQWKVNEYTVTFNANGGTGGKSGKQDYGTAIVAPTVTRTGYTFTGWSPAVAATVPASDVTYTAQWKVNEYTVTFNANGAGATVSPSSKKVTYDSAYGDLPTPTRADYTFKGWWTQASGGNSIKSSTIVKITSNTTLYAHWEEIRRFDVTFYGRRGADSGVLLHTTSVVSNTAAIPPDPNAPGYTFTGWSPADFSHVVSNMTIRAQYDANRYTVAYYANGGSGSMTNDVFTYDKTYNLQPNAYVRDLYEFAGWASRPDAATNEVEYADGASVRNLTAEANATVPLYAVWRSLLTDYSIAADCTNLILRCEGSDKWEIDHASSYCGASSIHVAGTTLVPMTVAISGTGTLTFRMKVYSASGEKISVICGFENADTEKSVIEDKGIVAEGKWLAYSFHKDDPGEITYRWYYSGIDDGDYAYVDQVHWYPNRAVSSVTGDSLTDDKKNAIIESILQHWDILLGDSAADISSITADGNSIADAVEIIDCIGIHNGYSPEQFVTKDENNHTASLSFVDVIPMRRIVNAQVTFDPLDFVYDGSSHELTGIQVILDGNPLAEGTDYTVSYFNNVNAGAEATLTLWGTNDGAGTYTTNFTIAAKSITDSSVTVKPLSTQIYTGQTIEPHPTVINNDISDEPLVEGTDYTLTWGNNVAVGEAEVTVTGMGNYAGSRTVPFTIAAKSVTDSSVTIEALSAQEYTGQAVVLHPTVRDEARGVQLTEGIDYTLIWANNVAAGEADVTVTGTGSYAGAKTVHFTIAAKSVTDSSVTIEALSAQDYTGSAICPHPTVRDEARGVQLTEGADYTLTWANNVDEGEADVTVIGKGNYKDQKTVHFTIKSKSQNALTAAFAGLPAVVEPDGAGGWKVSLTDDIAGATVEVPDDLGKVTLDLCGHTFTGTAGQPPLRIVKGSGVGNATKLSIVTTSSGAAVTGGTGAPAIAVDDDVQEGVVIAVDDGLTVQGGGANVPAVEAPETVSVDDGGSIVKATYDMSGAGWDYAGEFIYDGSAKTVRVTGLPAGVTASYTGNSATVPGTYTAHVSFAYDKVNYNAPMPMEDLVWSIREPEQPVEPEASGTLDVEFTKARTVKGVLRDASGNVAGMVQVKAGKIKVSKKKKSTVKMSASITMMGGKKVSAKSVTMQLNEDGTIDDTLVFKAPVGEMSFSMKADGSFILANAAYGMLAEKVGEGLSNGTRAFTVTMDPLPDLDAGFEFIGSTIPNGVAITISGGKKLDAGKPATIKYVKIKDKKSGDVWYDLVGLDDATKPNRSALKLSYAKKTGVVKGSFKVYATNAASLAHGVKPKLKKYSVKVWGLMIGEGNGLFGIGEATCKKLTTGSWRVDIK